MDPELDAFMHSLRTYIQEEINRTLQRIGVAGSTIDGAHVTGVSDVLARTRLMVNGSEISLRKTLNLINDTGITLSAVDNPGDDRIDVTIGT